MTRTTVRRLAGCAQVAALSVLASCAPALQSKGATRPQLASLSPDSISLTPGNVIEVELVGAGFDTSRNTPGNTVRVGPLTLRSVPSSAGGTRIRIAIPDAIAGSGEAPPAPWMSGRYAVSVSTPGGTSEARSLAITAGGLRP